MAIKITFVGLDKLEKSFQEKAKQVMEKESKELERELKTLESIKVTFKEHGKGGKNKYSIKLSINAHTKTIHVDHLNNNSVWNPITALHDVMRKAKKEIGHILREDLSYRKKHQKNNQQVI